jgi:two-component system phosphate regulon sensor histidine kinase PhoR
MPQVWVKFALRHAAVLIIGGAIGLLYGQMLIGLLVALCGLLAWHIFQLFCLERWLHNGKSAELPGGDGVWPRAFASIQFINERARQDRQNWRRLIKELRASTKAFPDGGIILNANHEIINYNKAARRLLGLKKKRDRGQRIDNLIRHPAFVAYLESSQGRDSVDIPGLVGADTWLSCRIIPYGPDQRLLLVRDITQSMMLERMRSDFVANASHEIRTPLTVISGYLDALADDDDLPDHWAGPIETMHEQAARMNLLVNDLLELSRLESSEPGSMEKSVDMAAILQSLQKEVSVLDEHPETIELQLDSEANLLGEEAEVQSIAANLVFNAVRYTPPDGRVGIRWQVDNKGGHLTVKDTGVGIAPEDIPRLTERFFRADSGRDRRQGGTGLGLAIVKHSLKRHDGELEIKSKLGEGSTFICHFPRSRLDMDEKVDA